MRAPAQINHDAFARFATLRRTVTGPAECAWCGQPARFQYVTQADDDNRAILERAWSRPFCSVGCLRSYSS